MKAKITSKVLHVPGSAAGDRARAVASGLISQFSAIRDSFIDDLVVFVLFPNSLQH